MSNFIIDLFLILSAGLIASIVCRWLRVSTVLGYLAAGAFLSESIFAWVSGHRSHEIELFAEAGVFLLLFSIGLEFSLEELAALRRPLLIGGGVQMALVAVPLVFLLVVWGSSWPKAILIGNALAFSSTVLVFKALAEAGQVSTRQGRRGIAVLLFQDAALVPLLLLIPILTQQGPSVSAFDYLLLAGTTIVFVSSIFVLRFALRRWVIPLLAAYRSPELVILFTVVLLGGTTLGAYQLGLPAAVGAFAAGLAMSGNRWTAQVDALILPFRETFSAVFFVSLGLLFHLPAVTVDPHLMLGGLAGLVALKSLAALTALRLTGLSWRSSFRMGFGLAHVGEFAFVLMLAGQHANLLSQAEYQWLVTLSFASLLLTPLFLKFSVASSDGPDESEHHEVAELHALRSGLIIGTGPVGRRIASNLETRGYELCLVDLSAVNLYPFAQQGFRTVAGDATDITVLRTAGVDQTNLVIVAVPDDETATRIVRQIRRRNEKAIVVVRCRYQASAPRLMRLGANYVVNEERQAAEELIRVLEKMSGEVENSKQ